MDTIQDVRVAIRTLAARPGFVAVAVLTLALGVGATTALFSVVHGVLLRPLPYHQADRLMALWQTAKDNPQPSSGGSVAHVNYLDWKRDARSFEAMALYSGANFSLTGLGEAEFVPGAIVTTDFFKVFGAAPVLGREFTPEEDRPAGPPVVVVSHAFWRDRLGGRTNVIGSTLEISGRTWEIVGVAPEGFAYPGDARLWRPVGNDDNSCGRACVYLNGIARLAPGATVDGARAEMTAIAERLERDFPAANTNIAIGLSPLQELIVGDVRGPLLLLLGAVAMLLLIACANVANLLLVRGAARQGEIAVRMALGAGRGRLVRFLLTESMVLALLGAFAGLLLAWWGVDALKQIAPPNLPRLDEVSINGTTFAFALAAAGVTALMFGLGPAVAVLRTPLISLMGARGQAGASRTRWSRSMLLVAEVALSLMLLVGAGLLLRSMHQLQAIDPGWRSEGVTVFQIGLPSARYPERADVLRTFEQLDEAFSALPGVDVVGRINGLPLGQSVSVVDFGRPDRPAPPVGQVPTALYRIVDGDYFRAMGIPILTGRAFDARDSADGQPVIAISREMADEFWRGEEALGKQITVDTRRTITAIVGGVRSTNMMQPPQPEMYLPHAQTSSRSATFVVRSALPTGQILNAVREVVKRADPRLPLFRPGAFSALEDAATARSRFYLLLLGLFAVLAMSLAAVGIYGVVAYIVTQRTREIGVRLALGAGSSDVLRLIVWQGLRPALAGVALGIGGALAAGRAISALLYQVDSRDPSTMGIVTGVVLCIVVLACAVPAWRATKLPPSTALRAE